MKISVDRYSFLPAEQCGTMAYAGTSYAQAADATLIEIF
jgi:hypothetical protein